MSTVEPAPFDEVASIFADYGTSLRGFVRYKLTQQNLEAVLPKKKLRVLDIGGGNGPDAAWLAQLGHRVTLLEPSTEQREYAERRFNFFLTEDSRERIELIPSTLDEFSSDKTYDLVLVHGVAMYQTKPAELIEQATKRVAPGGLISILEKGYWGAEARMVWRQDFEGLEILRKTKRYTNNLQQEVYAFLPEELEQLLTDAKLKIVNWSGTRVLTDEIRMEVADLDQSVINDIVALEYEHGHNPSIRGHGQMLHFIARRPK
ncbi:MAG TPA: methyltransferase domain-containing protein [Candidatus Saccharimonadales bacterium]